jgi:hypothetical protein
MIIVQTFSISGSLSFAPVLVLGGTKDNKSITKIGLSVQTAVTVVCARLEHCAHVGLCIRFATEGTVPMCYTQLHQHSTVHAALRHHLGDDQRTVATNCYTGETHSVHV